MSLNVQVPIGGGGGAGTVADITSTGGTITITAPTGPTTNVEVTTPAAAPATTVTGPDAYGASAVVGTGTTYARSDHNHGLPAAPAGAALATAREVTVGTGGTTVVTYTPTVTGNFLVAIYFRVITATTNVTVTVTWTDATGAQTLTLLSVVAETTGSYTFTGFMVDDMATDAITVTMTAGTASQVYASASILQG